MIWLSVAGRVFMVVMRLMSVAPYRAVGRSVRLIWITYTYEPDGTSRLHELLEIVAQRVQVTPELTLGTHGAERRKRSGQPG